MDIAGAPDLWRQHKLGRPRLSAPTLCVALLTALATTIAYSPSQALAASGALAGTVTEAASHKPIEGIEVCAFAASAPSQEEEPESEPDVCVKTGSGGEYTLSGLSNGSYTVGFGDPFPSALNYVTQYYDDKATPEEATPLTITGTTKTNIDAELEAGAEISGTTTSAATGAPVEGVTVCAMKAGSAALEAVGCAVSAAAGSYTISGLPSGSYDVVFAGAGYAAQAYSGATTIAQATVLVVGVKEVKQGIDASMQALTVQKIPILPGMGTGPSSKLPGEIAKGGLSAAKAAVSLSSTRIVVAHSAVARVKLRCSTALACHGKLTLTERRRGHSGKTATVVVAIGAGGFSLKPGQSATVKVDLGPTARRQLSADHGRLEAHLAIVQTASKPAPAIIKAVLLIGQRPASASG